MQMMGAARQSGRPPLVKIQSRLTDTTLFGKEMSICCEKGTFTRCLKVDPRANQTWVSEERRNSPGEEETNDPT